MRLIQQVKGAGIGATIILFFFSFFIQAQDLFPDPGPVFRDDIVPKIDILIPQESLDAIYDPQNLESDFHYLADFIYDDGETKDTVKNIGFRLRGNTSRYSQKKSFKVSFNTYEPGRKWNGLEKLNLNGEHNDPSVIRSKVCWDLLRDFEVPAARSNHVDLYINGNYWGIYINVEHIDEVFVRNRFGNNDGNLYKCLWPADLAYRGSDPDNYKHTAGNRRVYDLRTNTEEDDYTDIAHFIDILNNTPTEELACELDKVFNVDGMIRSIAFDILSGNWDGPLYNKNNFYLYKNSETGKFEYIPYDLDNTFGIDWFGENWATRNIYTWGNSNEARPIFYKLLSHPEHRNKLTHYIEYFIENFYNEDQLFPEIHRIRSMITSSVIDDPFRPLDYGFDYNDFINSYTGPLQSANHVRDGLKPFITTRKNFSLNQLEYPDYSPVLSNVGSFLDINSSSIIIQAKISYPEGLLFSKACFKHFELQYDCVDMKDDGVAPDELMGDGIYTGKIPVTEYSGSYNLYVKSAGSNGKIARFPVCEDIVYFFGDPSNMLKINEIMADNNTTIQDNAGEYDDWIELYNAGTETIFLGDKYITDDRQNPLKWNLPNWYIEPGAFMLFWADNDSADQGEDHLGFKLSKEGEFVGLYDYVEWDLVLLDGFDFGAQQEDISIGRYPDGSGEFVFMQATPGGPNQATNTREISKQEMIIFPNPASRQVHISVDPSYNSCQLYDINGALLMDIKEKQVVDNQLIIKNLSRGIYFLKVNTGIALMTKKLVVQ